MQKATQRHATRATRTESGSAPPAKFAPTMMEKATATAGAMCVMDWNRTSRRPMASRASPVPRGCTSVAMKHLLNRAGPRASADYGVRWRNSSCQANLLQLLEEVLGTPRSHCVSLHVEEPSGLLEGGSRFRRPAAQLQDFAKRHQGPGAQLNEIGLFGDGHRLPGDSFCLFQPIAPGPHFGQHGPPQYLGVEVLSTGGLLARLGQRLSILVSALHVERLSQDVHDGREPPHLPDLAERLVAPSKLAFGGDRIPRPQLDQPRELGQRPCHPHRRRDLLEQSLRPGDVFARLLGAAHSRFELRLHEERRGHGFLVLLRPLEQLPTPEEPAFGGSGPRPDTQRHPRQTLHLISVVAGSMGMGCGLLPGLLTRLELCLVELRLPQERPSLGQAVLVAELLEKGDGPHGLLLRLLGPTLRVGEETHP